MHLSFTAPTVPKASCAQLFEGGKKREGTYLMIRNILLLILSFPVVAVITSAAHSQNTIGTCEKDGFELNLAVIPSAVPGNNAAEALIAARVAEASFQLTSIEPGSMRNDKECTRIKWRSQGGCVKAHGILKLPILTNDQVAQCSTYNDIMQSVREMMEKNLRERVGKFRQELGQCVTSQLNPARVAQAQINAIAGDEAKNRSLQQQIDSLLEMAAFRVESCIPNVSVKNYGTSAYYQFDATEQKLCGQQHDPQMIGVNVYAPPDPITKTLMNEVYIMIAGGDGVMTLSHTGFPATIPGMLGSIQGHAVCAPMDAPHYVTTHRFFLSASEPVRWNGSDPTQMYITYLERKCLNTTC